MFLGHVDASFQIEFAALRQERTGPEQGIGDVLAVFPLLLQFLSPPPGPAVRELQVVRVSDLEASLLSRGPYGLLKCLFETDELLSTASTSTTRPPQAAVGAWGGGTQHPMNLHIGVTSPPEPVPPKL